METIICIDGSGSMAGAPIEACKIAVDDILTALPATEPVSIAVFDLLAGLSVAQPRRSLSRELLRQSMNDKLARRFYGGGGMCTDSLLQECSLFLQGVGRAIILSDGYIPIPKPVHWTVI